MRESPSILFLTRKSPTLADDLDDTHCSKKKNSSPSYISILPRTKTQQKKNQKNRIAPRRDRSLDFFFFNACALFHASPWLIGGGFFLLLCRGCLAWMGPTERATNKTVIICFSGGKSTFHGPTTIIDGQVPRPGDVGAYTVRCDTMPTPPRHKSRDRKCLLLKTPRDITMLVYSVLCLLSDMQYHVRRKKDDSVILPSVPGHNNKATLVKGTQAAKHPSQKMASSCCVWNCCKTSRYIFYQIGVVSNDTLRKDRDLLTILP